MSSSDLPPATKPARKNDDVLLVHSPTSDGEGWNVLRARQGRVEFGAIRNLEDGRPIHGEVVALRRRPGVPENVPLFDVEVQYAPPRVRSGPAQVATAAYRKNYDATFRRRARDDDSDLAS